MSYRVISLVLSSTYLTCAQWTRIKDSFLVSDLFSLPLLYDLSEVFESDSDINSLLNTAIGQISEKFSIDGQEFLIVLPEEIVIRDTITMDDSIIEADIDEYVRWQASSRFGNINEKWEYILQPHPWNRKNYLIQWIPADLKSMVRLTIEEKGARLIWMGTNSMVLQTNDPNSRQVTAIPEFNGYRIVYPDEECYRAGEIFYSSRENEIIPRKTGGGNVGDLLKPAETGRGYEFFIPGEITESRKEQWGSFDIIQPDLAEGITFEGNKPDLSGINQLDLQVIAGTIVYDNFHGYVNFLGDELFDLQSAESISGGPQENDDWEKKRVKVHDEAKIEVEQPKVRKKRWIGRFAVFVPAALLLIFLTPARSWLGINNANDEVSGKEWYRYLRPSEAIRLTAESLFNSIEFDSIHLLSLNGKTGRIAWQGDPYLSSTMNNTTENWIQEDFLDSIAGTVILAGAFDLVSGKSNPSVEKNTSPDRFLEILSESVSDIQIREMTMVKFTNLEYLPILVEVSSGSTLLQVFDVIKATGDNIALRKLEMVNDGSDLKKVRIYMSVFL